MFKTFVAKVVSRVNVYADAYKRKGIIGPLQLLFAAGILMAVAGTALTLIGRVNDRLDDGLTGTPLDIAANATAGIADLASFQPTIGLVIAVVVILLLLVGVLGALKFGRR